MTLPKRVAQHKHWIRASNFRIRRLKKMPEGGAYAHDLEEIRRDETRPYRLALAMDAQPVHLKWLHASHVAEDGNGLLPNILEIGIGKNIAVSLRPVVGYQRNDFMGRVHGHQTKHERIHHAENRRVGADAKREC
jgi:hypothetical protein